MNITILTLFIQQFLLLLNAAQLAYMATGYLSGALANQYPVLEKLFKTEFVAACTSSGCWQSIVPFLGSMYLSAAFVSVLALFFRPGRELRLVIVGLASVHIFMATVRLTIAPSHFYLGGAEIQASTVQFVVGALMMVSAIMPYAKEPMTPKNA